MVKSIYMIIFPNVVVNCIDIYTDERPLTINVIYLK